MRNSPAQAATNCSLGSGSLVSATLTGYILVATAENRPLDKNISGNDKLPNTATSNAATPPAVSKPASTVSRPKRSDSQPAGHCSNMAQSTTKLRSEERRVGKECRARWGRYH